ncbi:MAG: phosphorylase [Methylococcales bacterium]|nr:phosphorylase [Methylococcaceae bacterium]HIL39845.1 phosphorylase [Methylococcales bacterium]
MSLGIIVALPEELTTLTNAKITKGQIHPLGNNFWVILSGTGPNNASDAAQKLISHGADRLISWGCAGALSTQLKPGHLIIATQLIDQNNNSINQQPAWPEYLLNKLTAPEVITPGTLLESDQLISSGKNKEHLHQKTNADLVDMESAAIARIAHLNNLPFVAIRAIADTATMNLPKAISHSLDSNGELQLSILLKYLFIHPYEIPELIKLGLSFNSAKKSLCHVAEQLAIIASFQSPEN